MAKTLYGVEQSRVQPNWKLRAYPWLDMRTLKTMYSVEARDPELKKWAHIYNAGTQELLHFPSLEAANEFIKQLQGGNQ